ncbi:hypothetical protein [Mycolicibacterium arabiense]|uniref:hypothetical protein n=1 Tax=Mycolicibacterium arabiense TaxID=1286181 RepID=UPI001F31EEF5|nr:hypothetical protein [Mycolicibacterium arabiense]
MLSRTLIGLVAAGAAALGMSTVANAEPPPAPPPPPPNVNVLTPVKPSEFAAMDGSFYSFRVADGVTCVLNRSTGGYGCSGALPAAPNGANVVSGGQIGAPGFSNAAAPIYDGLAADAKPMPAGSRISFRNVTCGFDGVVTTCQNNFDQAGFVLSPARSFILNATNPLLDRPEGTNPYFN